MYQEGTPNFQRQHYLYWCNVYNLSHGSHKAIPDTTIRVQDKDSKILNIKFNLRKKL